MKACDAIVIGGGVVGSAIAFGLARQGVKVVVLDEGDGAFRASRGNFGLVWVQGKGGGRPEYQFWTRRSADEWPKLASELMNETGVDVQHERRGGVVLCLSEQAWEDRRAEMERLRLEMGNAGFEYQMLEHRDLARLLPGLGPKVVGGSYTAYDGHSNSLYLLSALHAAILRRGGRYVPNARVETIAPAANEFIVRTSLQTLTAPKLVLAAGLGIPALSPSIGITVPMKPQRGQNLITERLDQKLPLPIQGGIRQTREGGFQLGSTREYVGFDDRTTTRGIGQIARFAVDCFPYLSGVKVVRAWSALRVMPSDTYPIYDQSTDYTGAFVATCHSGVGLAAAHVYELAKHVAEGTLPVDLACFSTRRFAGRGEG